MGLVKGEIVIRGLGCFTEQTRIYASYTECIKVEILHHNTFM